MAKRRRGRPAHADVLTPAEWRVVDGVRHGRSDAAMAKRRGVSRDAIKFHVANAKGKLGLETRAQLRHWPGVPADSALAAGEKRMTTDAAGDLKLGPIGQIARGVKDVKTAEAFYRDVLGLTHLYTFGKLAFFDCGGTRLMVEEQSIVEVPGLHNDSVLYFRVPDIHAAQEELARRGVVFKGAPHMIHKHADGTEEWLTFFTDPDGGFLSLISQVKG